MRSVFRQRRYAPQKGPHVRIPLIAEFRAAPILDLRRGIAQEA